MIQITNEVVQNVETTKTDEWWRSLKIENKPLFCAKRKVTSPSV